MTAEQQTLADVKAEIDALPVEQRAIALKYAGIFRATITEQGPQEGALAMMGFALVGAELAAQAELTEG